jgi:hypothetical protein
MPRKEEELCVPQGNMEAIKLIDTHYGRLYLEHRTS